MASLPYRRVLLKVSGESLGGVGASEKPAEAASCISPAMLEHIVEEIKPAIDAGIELSIVVGGGNIYRGMSGSQTFKINRCTSDYMGMLATMINALALQGALEAAALPTRLMTAFPASPVGEPYVSRRAKHHLKKGRIVVFAAGTGNPYFTTDTAAALRALEMDCDLLLKATKVCGIYDCDPEHNAAAQFLPRLTYDEVLKKALNIMDLTAFTLVQDHHLPIAIFSIFQKNGLMNVLENTGKFTLVSHHVL